MHSCENKFNLHVNGISFSYERMSTKTHFGNEAKCNSEMTYLEEFFPPMTMQLVPPVRN